MKFKHGDIVYVEQARFIDVCGLGTIVVWNGSINNGSIYYVRLHNMSYATLNESEFPSDRYECDCHEAEESSMRLAFPLELAML